MKTLPYGNLEDGPGVVLLPETDTEREIVGMLRTRTITATACARSGISLELATPREQPGLAEALYEATRNPGMRPWGMLQIVEQQGYIRRSDLLKEFLKKLYHYPE